MDNLFNWIGSKLSHLKIIVTSGTLHRKNCRSREKERRERSLTKLNLNSVALGNRSPPCPSHSRGVKAPSRVPLLFAISSDNADTSVKQKSLKVTAF